MSVTNVIDLCLATTSFRPQTEHQTKYNMTSLVMSLIAENQGIILKYRHPGKKKKALSSVQGLHLSTYQTYEETSVTGWAGTA